MCGVYIHIPFCQSRCQYCDFFSTTELSRRKEYVNALLAEWQERQITPLEISTVYIGGGTPSLLDPQDIARIVNALLGKDTGGTNATREITLEANPGDLTIEKLVALREAGINRLSIGIQSFDDRLLRLIGRRHTAAQAREVVCQSQEAGFDNISIDLMYGLPTQTMDEWTATIDEALRLQVQHLSAYCLTYEENTPLHKRMMSGEFDEIDEDTENTMNDVLCAKLRAKGFEHYEVSNFALPGYRSRHNSAYWNDIAYIGLGAGAHSYDGRIRSWNIANLNEYISLAMAHNLHRDSETLTEEQKRMEYIMLGMRTKEGIVLDGKRIVPTEQDWHVLNRIIEQLI
ncbi:MAG: radical SAM family heme chaperone HemW [Paludibacteraceae bacterium]|nr:radical SAM family heme chaperone HemW [Paludibacteraceae bacterium]